MTHGMVHRHALGQLPRRFTLALLSLLLLLLALLSCILGASALGPVQVIEVILYQLGWPWHALPPPFQNIAVVWSIRLPRVVLGGVVGVSLALSGVTLQGLFRNPLADPSLVGVTGGAAFGATCSIVLSALFWPQLAQQLDLLALPMAAFIGGLIVASLIYRLARRDGMTVLPTMLLAGIAINALLGAAIGALSFIANDQQLRSLTFWSLGSLGNASWSMLAVQLPILLIAVAGMWRLHRPLNALLLGEAEAGHLGVRLQSLKRAAIFWVALAVAVAVAFTGMIGFIGLAAHHIVRLLIGADHRYLMPGAALLGASLMLMADLLARTLVAPAEIPVGILTALLGAPFFLLLLCRQRSFWGS